MNGFVEQGACLLQLAGLFCGRGMAYVGIGIPRIGGMGAVKQGDGRVIIAQGVLQPGPCDVSGGISRICFDALFKQMPRNQRAAARMLQQGPDMPDIIVCRIYLTGRLKQPPRLGPIGASLIPQAKRNPARDMGLLHANGMLKEDLCPRQVAVSLFQDTPGLQQMGVALGIDAQAEGFPRGWDVAPRGVQLCKAQPRAGVAGGELDAAAEEALGGVRVAARVLARLVD